MTYKLTKEQEEILEKMRVKNETKTIFSCTECKRRLIGMKQVRKHYEEYRHYSFNRPGHKGTIGFV